MTSKDLLDRIAALIALASSPELEEARTSAHKACAMMREHGLTIGVVEDDVLTSRPVIAVPVAAPGRPTDRRTRGTRTVIVFRCARCGRVVPKAGKCAVCIAQAVPMGIWTVDCQGCGRSTPPGRNELEVNEIAFNLGWKVTDDGITLCARCAKQRRVG